MPYDISRRIAKQWGSAMMPEESEVWDALRSAGYRYLTFDSMADSGETEDAPTPRDFTPVLVLYDAYLKYRRLRRDLDKPIDDLTIQQFGVAFRVVTDDSLIKARRWITVGGKRKQAWGYVGVKGPGSVQTRLKSGRPTKQ